MSYLTKRKFALRPVLDKKKEIEEAVIGVKQKQEFEQGKLDAIKTEFESVDLALAEVNEELSEISGNLGVLAQETLNLISSALTAVGDADEVLDKHLAAVKALSGIIENKHDQLEKLCAANAAAMNELAMEDARLERKRTDIKVYEGRLRKKLQDSGMEDVIKLVFE